MEGEQSRENAGGGALLAGCTVRETLLAGRAVSNDTEWAQYKISDGWIDYRFSLN
jgi:hypothetical protein